MAAADHVNALGRRLPTWPVYLGLAMPPVWLLWLAATGGLGVEPINALERELGEIALQLLIAGLAITPLRRIFGINLVKFRRAIGLAAFYHVVLHLSVWLFLDIQDPARIWADILKRPYITVGMAGAVLMVPLALTSNRWSIRRLGAAWTRLHRLTYAAALLGGLHFVMLSKGFQLTPLLYLGAVVGLLILRLPQLARRRPARLGA